MKQTQTDLFGDFQEQITALKTEFGVFACVAGYFIGNRDSKEPQNPISQKSIFYSTEQQANAVLKAGQWIQPKPETF